MIVSQTHNFIFIHIMKAAGTSVTKGLARHLTWRDLVLGGTPLGEAVNASYMHHLGVGKHSRAVDALRLLGPETWAQHFKFTFVRHPFLRTYSLYKYLQHYVTKRKRGTLKSRALAMAGRFARSDWLSQLPEARAFLKTSSFSDFIRVAHEMRGIGLQPQTDWVLNAQGELLVDFIGRTENFAEDFAKVLERIGLPEFVPETENETGSSGGFSSVAKAADIKFLTSVFEKDFEYFGYEPVIP